MALIDREIEARLKGVPDQAVSKNVSEVLKPNRSDSKANSALNEKVSSLTCLKRDWTHFAEQICMPSELEDVKKLEVAESYSVGAETETFVNSAIKIGDEEIFGDKDLSNAKKGKKIESDELLIQVERYLDNEILPKNLDNDATAADLNTCDIEPPRSDVCYANSTEAMMYSHAGLLGETPDSPVGETGAKGINPEGHEDSKGRERSETYSKVGYDEVTTSQDTNETHHESVASTGADKFQEHLKVKITEKSPSDHSDNSSSLEKNETITGEDHKAAPGYSEAEMNEEILYNETEEEEYGFDDEEEEDLETGNKNEGGTTLENEPNLKYSETESNVTDQNGETILPSTDHENSGSHSGTEDLLKGPLVPDKKRKNDYKDLKAARNKFSRAPDIFEIYQSSTDELFDISESVDEKTGIETEVYKDKAAVERLGIGMHPKKQTVKVGSKDPVDKFLSAILDVQTEIDNAKLSDPIISEAKEENLGQGKMQESKRSDPGTSSPATAKKLSSDPREHGQLGMSVASEEFVLEKTKVTKETSSETSSASKMDSTSSSVMFEEMDADGAKKVDEADEISVDSSPESKQSDGEQLSATMDQVGLNKKVSKTEKGDLISATAAHDVATGGKIDMNGRNETDFSQFASSDNSLTSVRDSGTKTTSDFDTIGVKSPTLINDIDVKSEQASSGNENSGPNKEIEHGTHDNSNVQKIPASGSQERSEIVSNDVKIKGSEEKEKPIGDEALTEYAGKDSELSDGDKALSEYAGKDSELSDGKKAPSEHAGKDSELSDGDKAPSEHAGKDSELSDGDKAPSVHAGKDWELSDGDKAPSVHAGKDSELSEGDKAPSEHAGKDSELSDGDKAPSVHYMKDSELSEGDKAPSEHAGKDSELSDGDKAPSVHYGKDSELSEGDKAPSEHAGKDSELSDGDKAPSVHAGKDSELSDGDKALSEYAGKDSELSDGKKAPSEHAGKDSELSDGDKAPSVHAGKDSELSEGDKAPSEHAGKDSELSDGDKAPSEYAGKDSELSDGDKVPSEHAGKDSELSDGDEAPPQHVSKDDTEKDNANNFIEKVDIKDKKSAGANHGDSLSQEASKSPLIGGSSVAASADSDKNDVPMTTQIQKEPGTLGDIFPNFESESNSINNAETQAKAIKDTSKSSPELPSLSGAQNAGRVAPKDLPKQPLSSTTEKIDESRLKSDTETRERLASIDSLKDVTSIGEILRLSEDEKDIEPLNLLTPDKTYNLDESEEDSDPGLSMNYLSALFAQLESSNLTMSDFVFNSGKFYLKVSAIQKILNLAKDKSRKDSGMPLESPGNDVDMVMGVIKSLNLSTEQIGYGKHDHFVRVQAVVVAPF